ncbi:hypothetical protein [Acinetobacter johnsonii]|uniref:hypothetical protein n=1 Tax=Acinetobacter johnsonii TaxID=40214 RepID=UPI0032B569F9
MNEIIYTQDELKDLSDDKILDLLAKSWGIDDGKFEVWGELPPLGDTSFGFLRNPYLVKTGDRLYYPLQGHEQEPCRFFVAPQDASRYGSKTKQCFIRCELELSPESERVKHNNPFSLCVKKGSGENLRYLPKEISQEILIDPHADNERSQFIAKSIYDFYFEKAMGDIDEEIKQKRSELEKKLSEQENEADKLLKKSTAALEKSEQKRDVVKKLVDTLNARQKELEQITEKLTQDKEVKHQEIQMLTKRFEQIEAEMNNKVKRLKSYVADKA